MSNPVATVLVSTGEVWARSPDGQLRPLSKGNPVYADDVIVTASGASVELNVDDDQPLSIGADQQVAMSRDLWLETATGADEAALNQETLEALAALELGGDVLDNLEETATGNSDKGRGTSFVQLARIINEMAEAADFDYPAPQLEPPQPHVAQDELANRPPEAEQLHVIGDEDSDISGIIVARDSDGDRLAYELLTLPANGTVTLDAATGKFIYTPNANYHGNDSFEVVISDGKGGTTTSTVTIDVTPVNDAPTTSPVSLITDEDLPASRPVLPHAIPIYLLNYELLTKPANGTVTLDAATGKFVYTPNANYHGNDSFDVVISDGKGGTTTSTVTIDVTPVNDAPTTAPVSLITDEDLPASGQVLAHDIDGDQ